MTKQKSLFSKSSFSIVLFCLFLISCSQTEVWGPGVTVQELPLQTKSSRPDWIYNSFNIHAEADFTIRARVLSTRRYRNGMESQLSPEDLALGWGPMSDEAVLSRLAISQQDRWYLYRWGENGPPIPLSQIINYSANMHIIPANENTSILLNTVKVGQIVTLRGQLVSVMSNNGWQWKSSLSRTDTGDGACELVWLESIYIEDAPLKE